MNEYSGFGMRPAKPTKLKNKYYSAIPLSTLQRMMGEDRWNKITKYIKKKYGKESKKLNVSFTEKGPKLILGESIHLGTVAKVERLANKKGK